MKKTNRRLCSLLMGLYLAAASFTGVAAAEKAYITPVGNGQYNLALNGGMETVENGAPSYWNRSQGDETVGFTASSAGGAYADKTYARLYGKTVLVSQTVPSFVPGQTYNLSAYVRRMKNTSEAILEVRFRKPVGNSYTEISVQSLYIYNKEAAVGEWTYCSKTVTAPAEATQVGIYLRLKEHANLDGEIGEDGEVHFDAVELTGKAKPEYAAAMDFRSKLWAEEAQDESTLPQTPNGLYEDNEPCAGEENLLVNSGFEEALSKENWGLSFPAYTTVTDDGSGGKCIRFLVDGAASGAVHPLCAQRVPIVGGAEYQVSFRYKVTKGMADPRVKLEYAAALDLDGVGPAGEKYVSPQKTERDGAWHSVAVKVYPPANANYANVLPRMMQELSTDTEEAYIDDVQIYMTYPPSFASLDAGWIFYYSDMTEGTLSTKIHSAFPAYAGAKVDYAILDGTAVKWESKNHVSIDGKTGVTFPLTVLAEKEKPYRARATIYEADGVTVKAICTQKVYLYDRPEYLGKDGVFRQNGKTPVYPVYAYHVNRAHYKKAAEAGINIVQMGGFDTAEAATEALDAAEDAGLMGLVVLYHDMRPAGDDINIEKTIRIVEAVKDHPALFGYGVMDEVFTSIGNPERLLENSYRLIHSIDKKHPVTTMEASANYYAKAAKFVDVLCIDPYSAAHAKNASVSTAKAVEITKGEKPVYALLWAYYTGAAYPSYNDGRNNNWQALMSGASAVGYFSVSDSDADPETGKMSVPIWAARDGGAFWNGLIEFAEKEKKIAFDRFVFQKYTSYAEGKTDTYWYSAWQTENERYAVVLGLKKSGTQTVRIPVTGAFRAECIAGRNAEILSGAGEMTVSVTGTEALLYKITPLSAFVTLTDESGKVVYDIPADETVTATYRCTVSSEEAYTVTAAVYDAVGDIPELVELQKKTGDVKEYTDGTRILEAVFTVHGGSRSRRIKCMVWDEGTLRPLW